MKLVYCIVRMVRVLMELISRAAFGFLYRATPHKQLPPIRNLLLLDSATALAAKIRENKVSSEDVVQAFIDRIRLINPILNCVVDERFELALAEAKEVDAKLRSGDVDRRQLAAEKPFLGVPFSTKDCMQVTGLRQTAGLYLRRNMVAESDADVVRLMRDAGAIMLCVTNVSELCMWWESSNTIYGRTNNPYDTNRIVGGSSGGEACLQAACGSPIGIGADIGGSIRMPAYFNGIFGHKPSSGIVSNAGQEPQALGELQKMLATGPMARHAADLRPALKVMAAGNAALLKIDTKVNMKQVRFMYVEDDGGSCYTTPMCGELKASMRAVVSHLQLAYGVTATKLELKELKSVFPMYLAMLGNEKTAPTFSEEMVLKQGSLSLFPELLKWMLGQSHHTAPGLLLCLIEKADSDADPRKKELVAKVTALRAKVKDLLAEDGVLLFPSHPTLAPYHSQPLFRPFNFTYTAFFNMVRLPVTQCPLGLSKDNRPLGIQVAANLYQDHLCLSVAEELEKAFGGWVCPSVVQ
uniref:Fatty-acid amide hydrolase 2-like n=1 Tax=Hirondellea gigas TaxID=1518452 RepID=A0A2P2IBG7_9CRUS